MKMTKLHKFIRDERGAGLAEYALIIPLFLALLLVVIEFSFLYYQWVMAEKATHYAVRLAAVRPTICPGLPTTNTRANPGGTERFGEICKPAGGPSICVSPPTVSCTGNTGNATFNEIFTDISPMLPPGTPANAITIRYESADLGFLGGPYVPVVSVELTNVQMNYITPFANLLTVYGAAVQNYGSITLPPMRATLTGEDLAMGPGA
jgi:Flp pilus assembly protein TadG